MRLNAAEIKTIVQTAQEIFGPEVSVYLFGSRIDDTKRGGDIDLLVCTPCGKQSVLDRILMKTRLKMRLGDQKIDIVGGDEDSPVVRTALDTGIRLV